MDYPKTLLEGVKLHDYSLVAHVPQDHHNRREFHVYDRIYVSPTGTTCHTLWSSAFKPVTPPGCFGAVGEGIRHTAELKTRPIKRCMNFFVKSMVI